LRAVVTLEGFVLGGCNNKNLRTKLDAAVPRSARDLADHVTHGLLA
jgi:hypothetical protein